MSFTQFEGGFSQGMANTSFNAGAKVQEGGENVVPLTLASIVKHFNLQTDEFKIADHSVVFAEILGYVREVKKSSSNISFLIDDRSGVMMWARYWIDSDDAKDYDEYVNKYIRLVAKPKGFQGDISLNLYSWRLMEDATEISEHYWKVAEAYHDLKNPPTAGADGVGTKPMESSNYQANAGDSLYGGANDVSDAATIGMNPLQREIYNTIRQNAFGENGIAVDEVMTKLKTKVGRDVLYSNVNFLMNEGFIYPTIDENHFKPL